MKRITYTIMLFESVILLNGVARNPANGFPAKLLGEAQQEELRAAVQELPAEAGIGLANWTLRQAQEEIGLLVWMGTLRPQPVSQ